MASSRRAPPPRPSEEGRKKDLQLLTIGKIPIPDRNIGCQDLLTRDISYFGCLRRKKPWNILGSILSWDRKYIVICKGCMYVYRNESDKKPEKALSLFGYTRVMRAGEVRSGKERLWPFKVAYVLDEKEKVHYFSAPCEEEMLKWMKAIKMELFKANGVEYSDDCIVDEDINDLETPISTGSYFDRMPNIRNIRDDVGSDSDLEEDYDYIDNPVENRGQSSVASSPFKPEPRKPVPPTPAKSKPSEPKPKPVGTSSSASTGYYPAVSLQKESDVGHMKPVSPGISPVLKSFPPAVPNQTDKRKAPNVKPIRGATAQEFPWTNSGDSEEGHGSSTQSVANIRQALFQGKAAPLKPVMPPLTPVKPQRRSPTETSTPSPSSADSQFSLKIDKPLPQLPPLIRERSAAPTCIVSPHIRNPHPPSRFQQDLEESALWRGDPGEGQRLLMSLGEEGAYMLRKSSDNSAFTLLVISDCLLRKYKIFKSESNMYSLQTSYRPDFDSVHNLVNHYRTNCLPTRPTRLSHSFNELLDRGS